MYIITIDNGFGTITFESNSRNAKKHAQDHGAFECIVSTKSGRIVSCVRYSDEFGYYYCNP